MQVSNQKQCESDKQYVLRVLKEILDKNKNKK